MISPPTPLDNAKTIVDIITGVLTSLAIVVGGVWFILRRSLVGTLLITPTLREVSKTDDSLLVVINVNIKNVGLTRVKQDYCIAAVELVDYDTPSDDSASLVPAEMIDFKVTNSVDDVRQIFAANVAVEPNEDIVEDLIVVVKSPVILEVGIQFVRKKVWPFQHTQDTWESKTLFYVHDIPAMEQTAITSGDKD
jgi:hypothetical protein